MIVRVLLALLLALTACESSSDDEREPVRGPTPGDDDELVVPVAVVNAMPDDAALAKTFLDGLRLGAREVNKEGGIAGTRLKLSVAPSIADALDASVATLVIGPGPVVAAQRADIERDRDPVLLLGGDLYSSRGLFRQVFQVSPPLAWQAEPMARYLVGDRRAGRVGLVAEETPGALQARHVLEAAMLEEGAALSGSAGDGAADMLAVTRRSDAVVVFGTPQFVDGVREVHETMYDEPPPPFALFAAGLLGGTSNLSAAAAAYPYTWAGWADPVPRVHRFRETFERFTGYPPRGFEQEGYDAVRVLVEALEATDGRGGDGLVRELESVDDATYSSLPIALGPDDHLFAGRGQIGIFARLAPDEIDDATSPTGVPWAPLMRTFTYNGRRTSVVDRDKDVFFPGWERREPSPNYQRSIYGITTSSEDPLH